MNVKKSLEKLKTLAEKVLDMADSKDLPKDVVRLADKVVDLCDSYEEPVVKKAQDAGTAVKTPGHEEEFGAQGLQLQLNKVGQGLAALKESLKAKGAASPQLGQKLTAVLASLESLKEAAGKSTVAGGLEVDGLIGPVTLGYLAALHSVGQKLAEGIDTHGLNPSEAASLKVEEIRKLGEELAITTAVDPGEVAGKAKELAGKLEMLADKMSAVTKTASIVRLADYLSVKYGL